LEWILEPKKIRFPEKLYYLNQKVMWSVRQEVIMTEVETAEVEITEAGTIEEEMTGIEIAKETNLKIFLKPPFMGALFIL
jgi:hypothetical protein